MINPLPSHSAFSGFCAVTLITFFSFACSSPPSPSKYGPDDEAETLEAIKPKVEGEAILPPHPKQQDLLLVDTGPTARQTFAIDAKSLTVSPDHIVRYTVVSTSSSGAKNTSYEGINCKSNELKRYAYSAQNGKWVRSREDRWVPVSSMSQNQFHYTLARFYFCQGGMAAGDTKDILSRIRTNTILRD